MGLLMNILTILNSIISFTILFILLNLALNFWGRLILKLIRVKSKEDPTLSLVSGLTFMVYLGYAIFPFTNNLSLFFHTFYLFGIIGSFISLFIAIRKSISNIKLVQLLSELIKRDYYIVSIILSLFISFLYSVVWPSGQMDVWANYGEDYYSWIFIAESLVGGVSPHVLDLSAVMNFWVRDSFGTYLIMDFIALANLKTPLLGSPTICVTSLIWIGLAIYALLKKSFALKTWLSLFLTLGVVTGSLLNYLSINGMFGHLMALIFFLVAIGQLCNNSDNNFHTLDIKRRFFIPFFLIYLTYQGGFLFYSLLLTLYLFLLNFNTFNNLSLINRLYKSIISAIYPILLLTIISCLLMPSVFFHIITRSLQVAAQTSGWGLPFFRPWHFVGFPFYDMTSFEVGIFYVQPKDLISYIPLIIGILILLTLVYKSDKKNIINSNSNFAALVSFNRLNSILSLTFTYIIVLIIYFIFSLIFGHFYKIWKFAAYAILPLSFIPLALFFKALMGFSHKKYPFFLALVAILSFLGLKFLSLPSWLEIPKKYFNTFSSHNFISNIQKIRANLHKSAVIIVGFNHFTNIWLSSIIFGNEFTKKTYFLSPFIYTLPFTLNTISDNYFILSDTKYDKIIYSHPNFNIHGLKYIYNYTDILKQGIASYLNGPSVFTWQVDRYPIHATFHLPKDQVGQELKLSVAMTPKVKPNFPCQTARLGLVTKNGLVWVEKNIDQLWVTVPQELTNQGTVRAILTIPQKNWSTSPCGFHITSFNLE
jgi:hypothetical protein